jgi:hypothetical protein
MWKKSKSLHLIPHPPLGKTRLIKFKAIVKGPLSDWAEKMQRLSSLQLWIQNFLLFYTMMVMFVNTFLISNRQPLSPFYQCAHFTLKTLGAQAFPI